MFAAVPHKMQYTNQLQFNLGVPLTTQNLAAHYNQPMPIIVERMGGQHGIPTNFIPRQASGDNMTSRSSVSGDKMEMMSILAKRDIRNRRLQSQMKSQSSESLSPACSPSRSCLRPKSSRERFVKEKSMKPHKPLTAKQADKNRRLGAVQTPPPPRPVSHFKSDNSAAFSRNTSMNVTNDSDVYFPAKPVWPDGGSQPKDEVEKLQQEVEGYLLVVEQIMQRHISDPGTKFLHPLEKGKRKDEFLVKEENTDRVRMRIDEQNTRLTRNLYNLRLKVKQAQRDAAHADFSKPTKKNQVLSQLSVVHRGALKDLQTFVNMLPHQDLSKGLPHHYHELSQLLKQLTALSALVRQDKPSERDGSLLDVLDRVNNLNAKCCLEQQKPGPVTNKNDKKSTLNKDWVSDTKVDKNIFVMKNQPELKFTFDPSRPASLPPRPNQRQLVQRGRPTRRASGKENRVSDPTIFAGKDRSALRSAITSLLQPKDKAKEQQASSGVARGAGMGRQPLSQDPRKGYLLPYDLIVMREKAQRAVALSNQEKRYMGPTFVTSLKQSPGRPSSAPANVSRHKEINFELDQLSPTPWIPPGRFSRSRSLSPEPKPPSRSPFYLHDMSTEDVRYMFPDKETLRKKKADSSFPKYGHNSLPTDRKLRSADVSSSFIDEVERRLLKRLMGREAGRKERPSRSGSVPELSPRKEDLYADSTGGHSDLDEPLETTDLVDATDVAEEARREAVSAMDAPTVENMKIRLAEMQREQTEIRQRWSTLKFSSTQPRSNILSACDIQSEMFRDPPAMEVTGMCPSERIKSIANRPISNECVAEPVIFTKSNISSRVIFRHSVDPTRRNDFQHELSIGQGKPPKKLVSLKQTTVEKILADRNRFQGYLRKRSHHPSGKFDPWILVEEISDEILSDCLADVAAEVELISEEIANHMYKSEFVVDKSHSDVGLHSESQSDQPLVDAVQHQPIGRGAAAFSSGNVELNGVRKLSKTGGHSGMGDMFLELTNSDQFHNSVGRPVTVTSAGQQNVSAEQLMSAGQQNISAERLTSAGQQNVSANRLTSAGHQNVRAERLTSAGQQNVSANRLTSFDQQKVSAERLTSFDQQKVSAERLTSFDQQKVSAERLTSAGQQNATVSIPVTARGFFTEPLSPDRLSPIVSAAEPQLEDISHLLHREDRRLEEEERGGDVQTTIAGKNEYEDDGDEYEDDYESSEDDKSKHENLKDGDGDSNVYESSKDDNSKHENLKDDNGDGGSDDYESSKDDNSKHENLKDDNGDGGSDDYEDDDFEDVTSSELKML